MVKFEYLYRGLCGMARAHQASSMAGHLGAAVVAGYFFGEDNLELDSRVYAGIQRDMDRIIHGDEGFWYNTKKVGISIPQLFEPFPDEDPDEALIPTIAAALTKNINKTRQSGHNVIFAATALRALHDHPMYATPSVVGGICRLISAFNGAVPGRGYYGKPTGWKSGDQVQLPDADVASVYRSCDVMVNTVVDELIESASTRRQGFGGLFHIINHAAGLLELSQFGYRDLAFSGLPAHHHHLRLWRSLPDVEAELGQLRRSAHDPRTHQYWADDSPSQWSARLTHRIKTLYGFTILMRQVDSAKKRKQAEQAFLYLMA
jgi:hypothetical protein